MADSARRVRDVDLDFITSGRDEPGNRGYRAGHQRRVGG